MNRMSGKVAIITGGARGMGAATARAFAVQGASVIVADVLDAEGQELARQLDGAADFHKLDVAQEDEWLALVEETLSRHGRIDALVNNAGLVHYADTMSFEPEAFDRLFSVNVKGAFLGIKHVGRAMTEAGRGSIVNIASIAGLQGGNGISIYSSTKWALRGLTKSAAMELGPYGVRVNAVLPGGVDTVMGNPEGLPEDTKNQYYKDVPLQRIGEPKEVVSATLFLCTDESSYICGAELSVDGGMNAGQYVRRLPGAPKA